MGQGSGSPSVSTDITLETVTQSLGASIFIEECKGDFARAASQADALVAAARTPQESADAGILRAAVHLLQGEPDLASPLLEQVLALVPDDADRSLRALSYLLSATHQRYNAFPDGNGVGADEVSARWRGARDLAPLDSRWHDRMQGATDPNARFEAWLSYGFLAQLQPSRFMIENTRFTPSAQPRDQLMAMATGPATRLRQMASAANVPRLAAFADWAAADLHRRSGNLTNARSLLDRAGDAYRTAGDRAGEALCLMTRADWRAAPFSSPLVWNLAAWGSSSASSALSVQTETKEFSGGTSVSYDEAETLYREAAAPRGLAAIQLRRGFQAVLRQDWAGAAACAIAARDGFSECGDQRGLNLASIHLLMCHLCGAGVPELNSVALARKIGAWGAASGSFSYALGLGILLNRLSRHWLLRRGHYERALACSHATRNLFEALGARINSAQCLVDQGLIHQAVGERAIALTLFERALDDYTKLGESLPAVTDNLRQRTVFLATDVYQLALQQTDPDDMERTAARLQRQLAWLPGIPTEADQLARLLNGLTGGPTDGLASPNKSDPEVPDPTLLALRPMIEDLVRQSAVLAPLYRSRSKRAQGQDQTADRCLDRATAALAGIPVSERNLLQGVLLAERKAHDEAAQAVRRHLLEGGANAGFAGRLTDLMKAMGGDAGMAQAALQERRTHEQAFSVFVMVHAYRDAYAHLQALEKLAGSEWWRDDLKPWQALCDMGEVYEARGETRRALNAYDRAIEELEARRASLSRDELKVALASDKGAQYLYFLAARAAVRADNPARGFEHAERGKARALLDLMAAARLPESTSENGVMSAWREAGMQLRLHQGLLAQARTRQPPDPDRIQSLEAQVAEDGRQLQAAEQDLARTNPRFHDVVSREAEPMSADAIGLKLPPGTLLIEYFFLGEDLLAWAIEHGVAPAAHHQSCDVAALNRDILNLHRACERRGRYAPLAERLAEVLLAPFADRIRACEALVIVPHGAAHALPFHVLPLDGEPLGLNRAVSYLPSASVLQWRRSDPTVGPLPERILAVGNPTLDLPAARGEAELIASRFADPVLLVEDEATEEAVRRHISSAPLVHLATHGILDADSPLNSAVALAGGDKLTVYELMLLRLRARLVVLSACSTAQGETTGGDDVLGLTRGLLAAGAEAALVSLWPVDDRSTALFMEEFYRLLRAGTPSAAALRDTQRFLRGLPERVIEGLPDRERRVIFGDEEEESIHETRYSHPYYWAPFVLVG